MIGLNYRGTRGKHLVFDPPCVYCMSVSAGILLMVSRSDCYQATAGSGVMSRGCSTNLWTVFSFPLTAGSGRETGMWMKTLRESPQRKEWVPDVFCCNLPNFSITVYLFLFLPCANDWGVCVSRDGPTPLTSPPPTLKIRSGTPVSVAGDGFVTGGTKQWTPGQR